MMLAADFRAGARAVLKNKWPVAIGTGFVATLLGASINSGGATMNFGTKISNSSTPASPMPFYPNHIPGTNAYSDFMSPALFMFIGTVVTIALVLSLVIMIVGGVVSLGYARFNLKLVDDRDANFIDLFSYFPSHLWKGFVMQFIRGLFIFLWSLLFIIPGIIAAYSYSMTPYILAESPDLSPSEAIAYSKDLMRGNKWRLFCLQFSFIGWNILSTLTLGIGFLALVPYQEAAVAIFYRQIAGEYFASRR